jgi:hypothetical protein
MRCLDEDSRCRHSCGSHGPTGSPAAGTRGRRDHQVPVEPLRSAAQQLLLRPADSLITPPADPPEFRTPAELAQPSGNDVVSFALGRIDANTAIDAGFIPLHDQHLHQAARARGSSPKASTMSSAERQGSAHRMTSPSTFRTPDPASRREPACRTCYEEGVSAAVGGTSRGSSVRSFAGAASAGTGSEGAASAGAGCAAGGVSWGFSAFLSVAFPVSVVVF